MTLLALVVKISVPPVLVALMSLAARRWGPTFGGLIMGLPWMTGPVLFFLGYDKGTEFLVAAALGAELAVWGIGAYILCFALASTITGWPLSLAAAVGGYGAVGLLTQGLEIPLWLAAAVAALVLLAVNRLLPRPLTAAFPGRLPRWDIPARMVATFALVALIMVTTDMLGPQRSGLIASYPVILTVIGVFTLRLWGRDALLRLLRGISLSLLAFVGFFAVVGFGAPAFGLTAAYAAATLTALIISAALLTASARPNTVIGTAAD